MNPLTRALAAVGARVKAAAQRVSLRWATTTASWTFTPSTWSAYGTATTPTPRANSICEAVVAVIARTFPESPVHVLGPAAGGKTAPVADHPLGRLVASPNPYYGGEQLWRATLGDWYYDGNAYWYKKRNEEGRPIQLWWLPAWTVEPYSDDPEVFVQHYVYRVGGREQRIPPADLVHFRNGLDPQNPRRGRSPFASVLSEVFQDQEAARFGQALLANLGIPGVVIAPQQPPAPGVDARQKAEEVKQTFKERFGGDRRGDPLVLTTPTNVQVLSFSPEQMDLTALRRVPEERISAVVGVSAMVVGLGVGYEHSIYNNYDVAYQALYETNLIPTQRLFAGELQVQLLPDLGDERRQRVAFDNSAVRVLQPDLDALWKRVGGGVGDAIITPNEAREAVGLKPLPGADVLYVKMTVTPTPSTELVPPEPEPEEPAPLEEPAALRALPPPKSRKREAGRSPAGPAARRKASGPAAHAAALTRLRDQQQPACEREMAAFLASQGARTAGKVRARGKAIGWREVFDAEAEVRRLNRVIRRWYERVLGLVHGGTQDALGTSFELDDALTRAYLAGAGTQVVAITETTRAAIAGALQAGQAEGEGLDALAKRVRALTEFSPARATVVARTELGMASQAAAVLAYRSSGLVTHVQVFDGTDDDDACRQANGQTWTLEQAANNPLQHPNCRRAFGPIVGAAEGEGAA